MSDSLLFKELNADDYLFRAGDQADAAYLIESGNLEVVGEDGEFIAKLGPGEIIGEMGVIDATIRSAGARAIDPCRLMVITREQLTERLSRSDPIIRYLVKVLLDRNRMSLGSENRDQPTSALLALTEMANAGVDKIRLETALKGALENDSLDVHFQPLADTQSRQVVGFEALTRWQHPERGFVSPDQFISLAEETDLIVPIGLGVFTKALEHLAAMESAAGRALFMSINVSARQIADADFLSHAARRVRDHQIDPSQIKLEVTESMVLDREVARSWLMRARDLGFKLSLDDFGTGYSNLGQLYDLPFDTVKLDKVFVDEWQHPRCQAMLAGVMTMLHALGFSTVVEGVEEAAQMDLIAAHGANWAQGYLVGKPMPVGEAVELLAHGG